MSTAILVVVTAVYAGMVYLQVRETRRQGRPYAYVEVIDNAGFLETRVRNGGLRPARNVTIAVSKDIPIPPNEHGGFLTSPLLQTPIPILSAGGCVSEVVAHFPTVVGALRALPPAGRILAYKISYEDIDDTYVDELSVDLSHLLGHERPFPEPTTYHANSELRDHITEALNRTGDILGDLARTLRERPNN